MATLRNLATRPHPPSPRRPSRYRLNHQIPVQTPQTSHQPTDPTNPLKPTLPTPWVDTQLVADPTDRTLGPSRVSQCLQRHPRGSLAQLIGVLLLSHDSDPFVSSLPPSNPGRFTQITPPQPTLPISTPNQRGPTRTTPSHPRATIPPTAPATTPQAPTQPTNERSRPTCQESGLIGAR